MKKLLLIFLVSFLNADVANLLSEIDNIKKHKNIQKTEIGSIYNPFLNYNDKQKKEHIVVLKEQKTSNNKSIGELSLEVIFNNRAKIDSVWYKKGDKIGKITILKILANKVILKNGKKETVLSIKSKNILKVAK